MSLRDIYIKRFYSSDSDDILREFYIPVLSNSVEYCRLAGFFSSTSLAIAARGVLGLIKNGGIMKMVICPRLTKDDLNAIIKAKENPKKYIENKMIDELEKLEDEFIRDHVYALGWMVANKRLEIKVAIVHDEEGNLLSYDNIQSSGIFHQKIGILKDKDGNIVTFSGSVNETATGWLKNIEEFKVFRNWVNAEKDYVDADIKKFKSFWNDLSKRVRTINIPEAVKEKLITLAPKDIENINLDRWYKHGKIKLYSYQEEAIDAWIKNNMLGIFEMATGTGKTFTALGCVEKVFAEKPR